MPYLLESAPPNRSSHAWRTLPVLDRIVGASSQHGPCFVYSGPFRDGYGLITRDGRTVNVHRAVWEELVGPIPEGMTLDHLCRNRPCWWPDHLEVVTRRVNTLRGEGLAAQNARKNACPEGHPFTKENTYLLNGSRHCRECGRRRTRAWYHRTKEDAR